MAKKFYCYVDETGQDTRGSLFIVSVVVAASERDEMRRVCETIERETGKNRVKWSDAAHSRRLAFIQRVFSEPVFQGRLNFAAYYDSRDYVSLTVDAISRSLRVSTGTECEATVMIDALPRSSERAVGLRLRRQGIRAKKVRGVKDESDALIRLADALCGFVRSAKEGLPAAQKLLGQALETGWCKDVSQQ